MLVNILITLFVAAAGSYIALRCKIPAGAFIGAAIAIILLNLFTSIPCFPPRIRILSVSLVGAYLGCRITREDLLQIRKFSIPVCTMAIVMLLFNLISSALVSRFAGIDYKTAIFAFAPGGVVDMSLVALDVGANMAFVSSAQVFRLVMVIICTPFSAQFFLRYMQLKGYAIEQTNGERPHYPVPTVGSLFSITSEQLKNLLLTVIMGLFFGIMGYFSGLPAGTLCFSMFAVTIMNIKTGRGYMAREVRRAAQMVSGIMIGMQISLNDLKILYDAFVPVFLVVCGWLLLNVFLGLLIYRMTHISMASAFFACSAGGMTDMGIISSEMGGNPAHVTAFQIVRLVSVLTLYPAIAQWLVPI